MRQSITLASILAITASPFGAGECWGGAWTQPKGKGIVIATLAQTEAIERYGPSGQTEPFNFERLELRAYGEFGLTDRVTILGQAEWREKTFDSFPFPVSTEGLGRFDVGARVRLHKGETWVYAMQGSVRPPGAQSAADGSNIGDTEWELDARLLAGRGFDVLGRHGFTDIQIGYRHRFGDPADELRLDTTLGVDITPRLLVMLQSFNTITVGEARGAFEPQIQPKIALSAALKIGETWRLQAGAEIVHQGRNVLNERGLFASIWKNF